MRAELKQWRQAFKNCCNCVTEIVRIYEKNQVSITDSSPQPHSAGIGLVRTADVIPAAQELASIKQMMANAVLAHVNHNAEDLYGFSS